MSAGVVVMIIIFSILLLFPAVLFFRGLMKRDKNYWPSAIGLLFAGALMIFTLLGQCSKWNGADAGETSEGAVICATQGDCTSTCKPDI